MVGFRSDRFSPSGTDGSNPLSSSSQTRESALRSERLGAFGRTDWQPRRKAWAGSARVARGWWRSLGVANWGKTRELCLDQEWQILRRDSLARRRGWTGRFPKNAYPLTGTDGSNPLPSRGESVSLPHLLSKVENPAFRAGVRGWLGDRVGRDAQGVSISRQPATISLSGHIPVPRCRWSGRRECRAAPNEVGPSPGLDVR